MIKFFRKIRKNKIKENRTSKYLLYAIGEIVLVVIGILIALQINNWNENKKNLKQANSYLSTIKLNLEDDIKQAENLLSISQTNIEYANIFLDQFKTLKPVDENIQMYIVSLMLEYNIEVNKSGIDALTSSNGMPNINKNLQVKILNYYRHIEQLKSRENISRSDIKALYEPYVKEHYNRIYNKTNPWPRQTKFYKNDPRPPTKIDEKSLLADKQLEIMVFGRRWQYINLHDLYTKTITLAQEIISDIEKNNANH
jgi:Family of unknown function (DUF6090)